MKKLTFSVDTDTETMKHIKAIQEKFKLSSEVQVARVALATLKLIGESMSEGSELLIRHKDGSENQVKLLTDI